MWMPLRKVHELTFLFVWFAGATPEEGPCGLLLSPPRLAALWVACEEAASAHGWGPRLLARSHSLKCPFPITKSFNTVCQARKRHININFFVRLVLGRPQVCPGDFTGFVPGTNPVKIWDKSGLSPYFTQWKPDFPGFVPGTNPVCPWDNPGDEGRHRKFMWKKFMCLFRSLVCVCVQTRGIAKTSGFTRGVCKNRWLLKFRGFLWNS